MPESGMELVGEEEIREVLEVLQSGYLFRYQVGQGAHFQGKVVKLEPEKWRDGVEIGKRPFLGLDFRYTELQAAVLCASPQGALDA